MSAFPGVIFNYTQPAEDAVDEAETGLKSLLAVKIFGGDLATLEDNARQVKRIISKVPGIADITVVRELGQPSLTVVPDREKIAQYGLNVDDVNTLVETAMGGKAASQVIQGERQFDLAGAHAGALSQGHGGDQESADRHSQRPASSAQPVRRYSREQWRVFHLSRIQFALHRRPVQRPQSRPGGRRRGSAPRRRQSR